MHKLHSVDKEILDFTKSISGKLDCVFLHATVLEIRFDFFIFNEQKFQIFCFSGS